MTSAQRSSHMAKIRSKNTKPELLFRSWLHRSGYRYRLHVKDLPGRPDLVFARRNKVVFVNGCFWHGHECPVGSRLPKTNTEFWSDKRQRNKERDASTIAQLNLKGWDVLVVWECEIVDGVSCGPRVMKFLDE